MLKYYQGVFTMINIITGRQTDPLQNQILDLAIKDYLKDPDHPIFIIVPNHIKFSVEVRTLNKLSNLTNQNQVSVKNLQILSFSRLAWYFLRNENKVIPEILDDATSIMLLEEIVREKKDDLLLFRDTEITQGALKQIYDAILMMRQGNLDLNEIDEHALNEETKYKIHDLRLIFDEFVDRLADKFAPKDEMQFLLNQFLAENNLAHIDFYFSDFSHFSNQEQLTLQLIAKKAHNLTIAFKTKTGDINPAVEAGDYDYVVQKTINKLEHFFKNQALHYQESTFPISSRLTKREKLNNVWANNIKPTDSDLRSFIQPVKADSRYAEAYFVARTIYQQVALNNYRYSDFLVLAPNLEAYETYLTPILRQNKIPFFNDLQRKMKFHPLVIAIENLFQIYQRGFQTSNLLALMKSNLFIPDWYHNETEYQNDVDQLENFALAHGINQNLWQHELNTFIDAQVIALDDAEAIVMRLEKLRKYYIDQIEQLFEELKKEMDTQLALTKFWDFLIQNKVHKQLEKWRSQANDTNDLQKAQQPEQVWSTLNQLLKDFLLLNPNFNLESFFQVLIAGFSEADFSQIPSTLDAVDISELGMVQGQTYKQIFILGATSNDLPQIEKIPGFFSTENIDQLNRGLQGEQQIEDGQKVNNLDQNYQFGNALSLAQDRIYLSYPVLNTANEELEPSIFYRQLLNRLDLDEFEQHDLPQSSSDILSFITNPEASLGYLTHLKRENYRQAPALLKLSESKQPEVTKEVLAATEFKNIPHSLTPEIAQALYGANIETSVSQLETYYENSFEYFLNYGLRLHKRFENELDVVQAGNYYHETFDRLVKFLQETKLDLASLTVNQLQEILIKIHTQMQEQGRYRQLLNDPFNQYLFRQLDQTTENVAKYWHRNLKKTTLRPQYSELSFGRSEQVKGLNYTFTNPTGKHQIDLRGKMDRIDLTKENNKVIGAVVDYKSSTKKFDLGLFANGISLQMVSYLDVLKKNNEFFANDNELDLLGAFYQTITKNVERLNVDTNLNADFNLKDIKANNEKKLMYKGILNNDPALLESIEPLLQEDRASSELYNGVKRKVDGSFSLPSDTSFNAEDLDRILEYNSYLIQQAAHKILDGNIELNPYQYNKKTPLQYSDFKDIFFFDAMLKENNYHKISSLKKKELLQLIKETLEKED